MATLGVYATRTRTCRNESITYPEHTKGINACKHELPSGCRDANG